TRQRLLQRRMSAVMREVVEDDQDKEVHLPHTAPVDRYIDVKTRNGGRRRVATGEASRDIRGMRRPIAKDSSWITRRLAGTYEKDPLATWERGAAGQVASASPGPPPSRPARASSDTRRKEQ